MYKGHLVKLCAFQVLSGLLEKNEEEGGLQTMYQRLERKHLVRPGVAIVKMSDT